MCETVSQLVTAQHDVIKNNNIKVKSYNTQKNNKCRLWSDRNERVYHINK